MESAGSDRQVQPDPVQAVTPGPASLEQFEDWAENAGAALDLDLASVSLAGDRIGKQLCDAAPAIILLDTGLIGLIEVRGRGARLVASDLSLRWVPLRSLEEHICTAATRLPGLELQGVAGRVPHSRAATRTGASVSPPGAAAPGAGRHCLAIACAAGIELPSPVRSGWDLDAAGGFCFGALCGVRVEHSGVVGIGKRGTRGPPGHRLAGGLGPADANDGTVPAADYMVTGAARRRSRWAAADGALLVWTAIVIWLSYRYWRERTRWTEVRLAMTHRN